MTTPLDSDYMGSYTWSFETIPLSRMVAVAKYIQTENAPTPFLCFKGGNRGFEIFQLWTYTAAPEPRDRSFELITATIGPQASLLWCSDPSIKNALHS